MPVVLLDDLAHPELEPYRHLKHQNATRWSGRFIVEGHRCVRRLLESRFQTVSVLASERRVHLIRDDVPADIPLLIVPEDLAESLVGFAFHSGVIGCGRREPPQSWSSVLPVQQDTPALVVACPRTTDPNNLGGLIRLCSGFGVSALALDVGCVDPFSRRVLRVSMGNAFHLPIIDSDNLEKDVRVLRDEQGFEILATVLHPDAVPLARIARPRRLVLLLGNEADGLNDRWVELSDEKVMIPMADHTDSLNVTVAAGIMLHHFQTTVIEDR